LKFDREQYFEKFNSSAEYTIHPKDVKTVLAQGFSDFNEVSVNWTINNVCQLDCTYCYAKKDMMVQKPESSASTIQQLKNIKVPFNICLLGGEPSLHSNIIEIVDSLCSLEHCHDIDLTTNLVKDISFWKKFNKLEYKKLNINASYHPEYNVHFLEKVIELNNLEYINVQVNVNILPEKEFYDETQYLIKELQNNKIQYVLNNIHETEFYKPKYTEDYVSEYEDTIKYRYLINGTEQWYTLSEIYQNNLHHFKGYKCRAQDLVVTQEGQVKNMCTYKNVLRYTEKERDEMVLCPLECCSCNTMLRFWKHKG